MITRQLNEQDKTEALAFAKRHLETAFFLANDLTLAPMHRDPSIPYSGDYFGYFEDGKLEGLAGHFWIDNILICAPKGAVELARTLQKHLANSHRLLNGICGPVENIDVILDIFNLRDAPIAHNEAEIIMRLELKDLIKPRQINNPILTWQHPKQEDSNFMIKWLYEYDQEAINRTPTPELWQENEEEFKRHVQDASNYILRENDIPVSYAGINSALDDIVQIGPMWTPPQHRNKGYARTALAGSLLRKKEQGINTAILFADDPAAINCYKSIGFKDTGLEYGLCLFDGKQSITHKEISKITGT